MDVLQKFFLHFFAGGAILGALLFEIAGTNRSYFYLSIIYICLFVVFWLIKKKSGQILCAIAFSVVALVLWRGFTIFKEPILPQFNENTVTIVGQVVAEPDIRETNTRLTISAAEIQTESGKKIYSTEKIIVVSSHYPMREIGDPLKVTGSIQVPENFQNENGIEFDYVSYLGKDLIRAQMYYAKIETIPNPDISFLMRLNKQIFRVKQKFLDRVQKIMPSPEAELLGGILLGTKRSLGEDLENQFRRVGLIHIVVLSGYNVTIIAEAIFRFFGFLPRLVATTLGVISILIFTIMVGSGATVIRATIMALLALASRISGRTYGVNRALFFAGALMIIHNPMVLLHDPSFQLSFVATLGLINFSNVVKKLLRWLPNKLQLREISTATLSTQLSVLPLLMKMTGELSVVAPIVNILTLQVIPLTMLLGFIAGVIAFISEKIGFFIGILPFSLLRYILLVVNFFARFHFATWKIV